MPRVLLTAFGPYDDWQVNASWLVLQELTRELPPDSGVVTRLYPVEFSQLADRLASDITKEIDLVLHLGQAPRRGHVALEAIGLNVACERKTRPEEASVLVEGGPVAYRSELPLGRWASGLRRAGIPADVSYHAGTYLCNAALYLTQHLAAQRGLSLQAASLHLPLTTSQAVVESENLPSLPVELMAQGVRWILGDFAGGSGY